MVRAEHIGFYKVNTMPKTMKEFADLAARIGGRIVSAHNLTWCQIVELQAKGHFCVDERNSYSWGLLPWDLTTEKDRSRETDYCRNDQIHERPNDAERIKEPVVAVEIPASAVTAVMDFLERRSHSVNPGFCFGVALPSFGSAEKSWAVFDLIDKQWNICSEQKTQSSEL